MAETPDDKRSDLLRKIRSLRERATSRQESQLEVEKVREGLLEEIDGLKRQLAEVQKERDASVKEAARLAEREWLAAKEGEPSAVAEARPTGRPPPVGAPPSDVPLPSEVTALRKELEAARKLEKQVRESRDALDEEIVQLRNRTAAEMQACRKELDAVLSRLAETTKTRDFLEAEVESVQRLSTEESAALRKELDASRRAQEEITTSRDDFATELSEERRKSSKDLGTLRREIESLQRTVERLKRAKAEAEDDIDLLRAETAREIDHLKQELGEAHRQTAEGEAAKGSAHRRLEQERQEAVREKEDLRRRLDEAETRADLLRKDLASRPKESAASPRQGEGGSASLARIQDEKRVLEKKVADLEAELALQKDAARRAAEPAPADRESQQLKGLRTQAEDLERQKEELEKKRDSLLEETLRAKEREAKSLEELEEAQRSAAQDRERLRALEEENREYARTVEELRKEDRPVEPPSAPPPPPARDEGAPEEGPPAPEAPEEEAPRPEPTPSDDSATERPFGPEEVSRALEFLYEDEERPARIETDVLRRTVRQYVDHVREYPAEALGFSHGHDPDGYLRRHCHHVCRLAIFLAWKTGCRDAEVEQVGLAALLHDAGLTQLPEEILFKHASLTSEKLERIRAHAEIGADIARSLEGMDPEVPEIIRQHHESLDGRGYPQGLKGDGIHRLAKILALVDGYEAIAAPRVYREETLPGESMSLVVKDVAIVQSMDFPPDLTLEELSDPNPSTAMGIVVQRTGVRYDPDLTRAFLHNMGHYPLGSYVEMEGGKMAKVVAIHPEATKKPIVQIVKDSDGKRPDPPVYVDLLVSDGLRIERPLSQENAS